MTITDVKTQGEMRKRKKTSANASNEQIASLYPKHRREVFPRKSKPITKQAVAKIQNRTVSKELKTATVDRHSTMARESEENIPNTLR